MKLKKYQYRPTNWSMNHSCVKRSLFQNHSKIHQNSSGLKCRVLELYTIPISFQKQPYKSRVWKDNFESCGQTMFKSITTRVLLPSFTVFGVVWNVYCLRLLLNVVISMRRKKKPHES
jgi:hypothetical protein